MTSPLATSITETSLDGPLAVNNLLPSRLSPIPPGRTPTLGEEHSIARDSALIRARPLPRPQVTNTDLPSCDATTPIGREPSGSFTCSITFCDLVSITDTEALPSLVTNARLPSSANSTPRGRAPTAS